MFAVRYPKPRRSQYSATVDVVGPAVLAPVEGGEGGRLVDIPSQADIDTSLSGMVNRDSEERQIVWRR